MASIIGEVTEIPEHLLKRSRSGAPRSDRVATPPPMHPATPLHLRTYRPPRRPPPPAAGCRRPTGADPRPPPPRAAASQARAGLRPSGEAPPQDPVLGDGHPQPHAGLGLHVRARRSTEPPEVVEGPLGIGEEVYGGCASCHGADGGGVSGLGYQFTEGEVLKTFPNIEDQTSIRLLRYRGLQRRRRRELRRPESRGRPPSRPGARGPMPAQAGSLTDERNSSASSATSATRSAGPTPRAYLEEFEKWCSEESPVFAELEAGTYDYTSPDAPAFGDVEIMPVGPDAVPGSPPSAG